MTCGLLWTSVCGFGKRVGCKPSRVRIPHPPPTLKTGSDLRKRRSDQIGPGRLRIKHRGGQSQFRSQFPAADCPKSGLPRSRRVRRRSLTYASPDQPAAKAGVVAFTRVSLDLCRENQCLTQVWLTLARSADMPGATSPRESDGLGCRGSPGRALPSLPPARRRLRPPPTPYATGIPTAAATRRL